MIKVYAKKGYIWNPNNCKCERDKSCDFGEYLDYENCKCRKRLEDKLIEECNENIEETSLTKLIRQSVKVILAYFTLCYFQHFLQSILELLLKLFITNK